MQWTEDRCRENLITGKTRAFCAEGILQDTLEFLKMHLYQCPCMADLTPNLMVLPRRPSVPRSGLSPLKRVRTMGWN